MRGSAVRTICTAAAIALATNASQAAEIKISAVSFLPPKDMFAKPFLEFVEDVNKRGAGSIHIDVKPMGAVTPPNIANAVKSGAVDLAYTISSLYKSLLPSSEAIFYMNRSTAEIRANGGLDLWRNLHADRLNAHYLGHWGSGVPFYFYLVGEKPIKETAKGLDFNGMRIRISSGNRALVRELGGAPIQTSIGEIYTALERNMVDGVVYPGWDLNSGGWGKFIKARVDAPFYSVMQVMLVNLDKWRSLNDAQRNLLQTAWDKVEAEWVKKTAEISAGETALQQKDGVKLLSFPSSTTKAFADTAYAVGWAEVISSDPENGPKLKALFFK